MSLEVLNRYVHPFNPLQSARGRGRNDLRARILAFLSQQEGTFDKADLMTCGQDEPIMSYRTCCRFADASIEDGCLEEGGTLLKLTERGERKIQEGVTVLIDSYITAIFQNNPQMKEDDAKQFAKDQVMGTDWADPFRENFKPVETDMERDYARSLTVMRELQS